MTTTIIRSKRKTAALVIDREGQLVVRAPLRMPKREIDEFVEKHRRWVEEKQQQVRTAREQYCPLAVETGERLPFLGQFYTLMRDDIPKIAIRDTRILIPVDTTREKLVAWLKREARRVLTSRTESYAHIMGVRFSLLRLSGAQARWGSCSASNSLNFAWRLILCPPDAIDYVVVHELCHISHKNHGPDFWAQVKAVLPNYQEQRAWLKANRQLLHIL
jgi:predicted metal-dependent hydrolase